MENRHDCTFEICIHFEKYNLNYVRRLCVYIFRIYK